ncbi:hypothetical protein FOCC_FOCC004063 [Frankliniella occidentalis]|nr:hypothetical protein FOCC_FOCC004063 [Frankliniella occidentalis]
MAPHDDGAPPEPPVTSMNGSVTHGPMPFPASCAGAPLVVFATMLIDVVNSRFEAEYQRRRKEDEARAVDEEYDFIVVGGGTSGCILASRLSESTSATVLLLERGGTEPEEARVPALQPYVWRSNSVEYPKSVSEQQNCNEYHSSSGPQRVSWQQYRHPVMHRLAKAMLHEGVPFRLDVNSRDQLGFTVVQTTTDGGERYSTYRCMDGSWRLNCVSVVAVALHPSSRGSVRLNTSAPTSAPVVRLGYYEKASDVDVVMEGVRRARRLAAPLRSLGLELMPNDCGGFPHDSDEYARCLVRTTSGATYHWVGSCPMGPGDKAVVDTRLRVHGLRHLRVADASVMPSLPSGNTMAAVIMVAEYAADLIKKEHVISH